MIRFWQLGTFHFCFNKEITINSYLIKSLITQANYKQKLNKDLLRNTSLDKNNMFAYPLNNISK